MPASMTTATEILKEVYIGRVNAQLDSVPTTYNRLTTHTNPQKYGGKYIEFPIHVERNSGLGARSEGQALPTAGQQKYRQAQLKPKDFYAAFELTGQVFDYVTEDYQAFANEVQEESNRVKDDCAVDRNRQVYGDGSGTIAIVASVAGQVITLSQAGQLAFRVQDGMKLDIMVGATNVIRQTGLVVTDIDLVNNTTTVTGTLTGVVAGDILVRQGNYGLEWTGLAAIVADNTSLYGISPNNGAGGSRWWRSYVNTQGGTGTNIAELTMARACDRIRFGGGTINAIYSSPGVFRAYWALLKSDRRFVNPKDYGGGYSGLSFTSPGWGEIPFLADDQATMQTMYFVNEDMLDIYRPYEYKLIDRGGSTWHQKQDVNGVYDIWQAWLAERSEIGTRRRNSHGKITNINEDPF